MSGSHLVGSPELVTERVAHRSGHFMPAALVDSQFAALEPLRPDERGGAVSVSWAPERIAAHVRAAVARSEKGVLA